VKKFSIQILFLLIAVAFISGCGEEKKTDESTRTVLRIGTDATYPPFETIAPETGEPSGFDIDLITEICRTNNWKPEFIVTPFDGIIPGLMARKYDLVISAMTITERRAAVIDFSYPYYLAGQTVAVPTDDSSIHGIDDLTGKRVGVQLGTTGEIMAKKIDGVHVYSYDNIGAAFIDMDNGNLDAILNDFPTTRAYIDRHQTARTVGDLLSQEFYGMAVRRGDTALLSRVNESLAQVRMDGRYDSIHVHWFGHISEQIQPSETDSVTDSASSE